MTSNNYVMETCLLAGEIMIRNGAETYRVEETMTHIAQAAGMKSVHSSVTTTSIIFSFKDNNGVDRTRMTRMRDRTINLNKVTLVNQVSRHFVSGEITLDEAHIQLEEIQSIRFQFSDRVLNVAAGLGSGSFAVLIGGTFLDFFPSAIAGAIVFASANYLYRFLKIPFFAELSASFLGGMFTLIASWLFPNYLHLGVMIIGAMIPLFPGVALTNSVRDLMAGDLVAGMARGVEAGLTALAVAVAAASVLSL
ncbi:threonine/serine exporter [Brevibacillus laterosporus]|uniref:Threonine/serine exporter n=1 Tax=Brevibacillus laterosporus TaxID=1465 RepID=A0A518V4R5_BRELA|nr:threonine/serine exporter [Brevibacillus laterosporus]